MMNGSYLHEDEENMLEKNRAFIDYLVRRGLLADETIVNADVQKRRKEMVKKAYHILAFPVKASAAAQGTDGTELEVVQAQQVEIQLGPNWSGVEFEMKTDAGMYPGTIPVGEDGILRFEVGGSESYILSCMNSKQEAPVPDETVEATEDTGATGTVDVEATIDADPSEESVVDPAETDATIPIEIQADAKEVPVVYVVITVVAVLLAVSALAYLILGQKKSDEADEDDEL